MQALSRTMGRILAASVAGAVALLVAGEAAAFCRSTTCRSTKDKECPTDESGCSTEGAKLFWPTSCLGYAMNRIGTESLDPEETRGIIRKAFLTFNDVTCPNGGRATIRFEELDPISCKRSEYNKTGPNVNVVLFQDANWRYRGIDGTLAKTSVTYNDESGEIYDADIEVNTANNEVTITDDPAKVEYDLQAILTHEVGHFIGIAHSPDPSAVMFASYSPGSTSQRRLHPDDVDAVCAIYPEDAPRECNAEPRNGFSSFCNRIETTGLCTVEPRSASTPLGVGALFGVASVATAVRRRRLRRGRRVWLATKNGGERR